METQSQSKLPVLLALTIFPLPLLKCTKPSVQGVFGRWIYREWAPQLSILIVRA